jgi:RND family efflux transporter MFP subunit
MTGTPSQARSSRQRRWPRLGLGAALALAAAFLTAGCHPAPPKPAPKAAAVEATEAITGDVTDYQDFTGRLDAFKTVDVRPRVSGYITDAPFKEGDPVMEGDVLFQIDDRPYKAMLNSAVAQVAASKAQINVAKANLEQAESAAVRAVRAGRSATGLELDQTRAQQQSAQASLTLAHSNLGTAEANLETARLNFEWTQVKSPLTGRVSRRNVDPGNLVNSDNTILTTVVQDDRMYVYFDVDERTYLGLVSTGSKKASWLFGLKYPVMMRLATEDDYTHVGTINFLDNRLNGNSGTIRMRGLFENPAGAFKSGLFARVRLPIGAPYKAVLVPDEAVLSDQGRKYVWVVKHRKNPKTGADEDVADYRKVTPGQALQGLRVIKEGLNPGERVIVTGTQRVRQDAAVTAGEFQPKPKAPDSPLTKLLAGYRPLSEDRGTAAGGQKPARRTGQTTEAGGGN